LELATVMLVELVSIRAGQPTNLNDLAAKLSTIKNRFTKEVEGGVYMRTHLHSVVLVRDPAPKMSLHKSGMECTKRSLEYVYSGYSKDETKDPFPAHMPFEMKPKGSPFFTSRTSFQEYIADTQKAVDWASSVAMESNIGRKISASYVSGLITFELPAWACTIGTSPVLALEWRRKKSSHFSCNVPRW